MTWERRPLGSFTKTTKGKKPSMETFEYQEGLIRTIQIQDLRDDSKIKYTSDKSGVFINAQDIGIAWDGANAGTVGTGLTGFIGSTIARITFDEKEVDSRYLMHFLRSKFAYLNKSTTGSTIPHVNKSSLASLEVPLPPLSTQQRIAVVLDEVDALRQKQEQAISLLQQLVVSTFLHKVGDPVNPSAQLETKTLAEIGRIVTGNTPSRDNEAYYGSYMEWIKSDNLGLGCRYASTSREFISQEGLKVARTVPSGSLLTTCIAGSKESIGKTSLVNRRVAFNQQINALIPFEDGISNYLLAQFWSGKKLVQEKSTDSMKGLVSKSSFESIKFIMLPYKKIRDLDNEFHNIFSQIDIHMAALRDCEQLLAAIQSRAFINKLELQEFALK